MAITIKDIARKIGKSTATVSRALNDFDDISPETKALVRQAAAELGYSPNTQAQRLQKQQADAIGLILPTFGPRFSDPFFSEFLAGIGNKAASYNYDLFVSTRAPGPEELDAYRFNAQSQRVDGFIVVRTRTHDERIEYLCQSGFPFVSFGRTAGPQDFSYVDEDGEYGMQLVMEHLLGLGHRRFGIIASPFDLTFTNCRMNGIWKKLDQAGIPREQVRVLESDLTQRGGYVKAQELLDGPNPPTALIAMNDLMAFGAMSVSQERGLVVGKDVSITGFDNIPMAEYSHPPLTTINQPIYQIGSMVCEMLIHKLRSDPLEEQQVLLQPSLILRQSTGPVS